MGSAVDLGAVQARQDAAKVGRERRKNLGSVTTHTHQSDGGLRVYAHLGGVDDADGVDLCLPSGRAGGELSGRVLVRAGNELSGRPGGLIDEDTYV